jgi:hypothetical protein
MLATSWDVINNVLDVKAHGIGALASQSPSSSNGMQS